TFHQVTRRARRRFDFFTRIKLLSAAFDQLRFVIEQIALARAAVHEQLNNTLHLCAMMQTAIKFRSRFERCVGEQSARTEQMRHRNPAEATAEAPEKFAECNAV